MAKYRLLADQWDQVISKPTEQFRFIRHRKGATVEITGADESRLLRIGAVEPMRRAASKSTKTEHKPSPEKPKTDDVDGDGGGDGQGDQNPDDETGGQNPDDSTQGTVEKPAKTGPVAAWREYAVTQGHDPDEAADATRADLIALYG